MTRKKSKPQKAATRPAKATTSRQQAGALNLQPAPPTVSGRWILVAVPGVVLAAALCAWGVLCLLFWQGSWQLLYHPAAKVARTPADAGLAFSAVGFDPAASGAPQLTGWWIPAAADAHEGSYTLLYLHGQDGNLGEEVDHLAQLHTAGVNVFAFDYRGYGHSEFDRPSEMRWREDADSALRYLTNTRHVSAGTIVLDGNKLGANLALEVAVAHPELAGVVLESPIEDPMSAIFNDGRARLVPARLLVHDRYDLDAAAAAMRIPSLWLLPSANSGASSRAQNPEAFQKITARKMLVWLPQGAMTAKSFSDELSRWIDDLHAH